MITDTETTAILDAAKGISHYGVRIDACRYAVGDSVPPSRVWDDGVVTDEILDGTSALCIGYDGWDVTDIAGDVASLEMYREREGMHVYLVGGTSSCEGNDGQETVIENAEVLHIF